MKPGVVALVRELGFRSKIREALDAKVSLSFIRQTEELESAGIPEIFIADLNIQGADAISALKSAQTLWPAARLIAFYSHVDTELGQKAKELGIQEVMPRSKFMGWLEAIRAC